jgi:hypothetical protein
MKVEQLRELTPDEVRHLTNAGVALSTGYLLWILVNRYIAENPAAPGPGVKGPSKTYIDDQGVERTAYHDPESDTYYSGADVAHPQSDSTMDPNKEFAGGKGTLDKISESIVLSVYEGFNRGKAKARGG